jgi:hypothetical protein
MAKDKINVLPSHEFELREKLKEAYQVGKYLITVTTFDFGSGKLKHYHSWKDFPTDDLVPSLSHITKEIEGKISGKESNT